MMGRERRSHRVVWILCFGSIPLGMQVLHHCDNPPCCNPLHLFLGTGLDNMRDKISKGRDYYPEGEDAGQAKLTTPQVLQIRELYTRGVTQRKIAVAFGVGYKAISKIVLRQRWKNLPENLNAGSLDKWPHPILF